MNVTPSAVRRQVVDRIDHLVLSRMATLLDRAAHGSGRRDADVIDLLRGLCQSPTLHPEFVDAIADSLDALWNSETGTVTDSPRLKKAIIDQFQRLYYHPGAATWQQTTYRGFTTWKCPLDLWIYQELVHSTRPSLIVETGTAYGGSALFLADLCELAGWGHVATIDTRDRAQDADHPRLTRILGSSIDPEMRRRAESLLPEAGVVMVILDSDHSRDHVLAELRLWWDFVTPGSYLIVEDTNINNHPVYPRFGPGPWEAVTGFMAENDAFEVDVSKHKFLLTWNPRGYLRRIG